MSSGVADKEKSGDSRVCLLQMGSYILGVMTKCLDKSGNLLLNELLVFLLFILITINLRFHSLPLLICLQDQSFKKFSQQGFIVLFHVVCYFSQNFNAEDDFVWHNKRLFIWKIKSDIFSNKEENEGIIKVILDNEFPNILFLVQGD